MEQSGNLGLTAEELTSLWILRAEIQGEKSQIFSLFINTLVHSPVKINCSSAHHQQHVVCWREMRSFLKPALFPTTGVPHVSAGSRCPQD